MTSEFDRDTRTTAQKAADAEIAKHFHERIAKRKSEGKTALDVTCQICGQPGKLQITQDAGTGRKRLRPPEGWTPVRERGYRMSACSARCAEDLHARLLAEPPR